jgi:hypothetical protein
MADFFKGALINDRVKAFKYLYPLSVITIPPLQKSRFFDFLQFLRRFFSFFNLCPGQIKTKDKSNEITAILSLSQGKGEDYGTTASRKL